MDRTADPGVGGAAPPAEVAEHLARISAKAQGLAAMRSELESWAVGPGRSFLPASFVASYCEALAAAEAAALVLVDALGVPVSSAVEVRIGQR